MANPATLFLILLVIGIAAGLIFDRLAGPSWLSRQIVGSTRGMVTSSLIGIAGSFIGYHIALIIGPAAGGIVALIIAAVGAALALWAWRMVR